MARIHPFKEMTEQIKKLESEAEKLLAEARGITRFRTQSMKKWVRDERTRLRNKEGKKKYDVYTVLNPDWNYKSVSVEYGIRGCGRTILQKLNPKPVGLNWALFDTKENAEKAVPAVKEHLRIAAEKKKKKRKAKTCDVFKADLKKLMKKHGITSL